MSLASIDTIGGDASVNLDNPVQSLVRRLRRMAGQIREYHTMGAAAPAERDRAFLALIRGLGVADVQGQCRSDTHIERIGRMAALLAGLLGQPVPYCTSLGRTAPLRTLGEMLIPDWLLRQPGGLTGERRTVMRHHIDAGILLLEEANFPELDMGRQIIRYHSELWDGSGYPAGLTREEIPVCARIITVVDTFDAMGSERSGRPAMAPNEVERFMRDGAGRKLDPAAVQTLLDHIDEFQALRQHVRVDGDERFVNVRPARAGANVSNTAAAGT